MCTVAASTNLVVKAVTVLGEKNLRNSCLVAYGENVLLATSLHATCVDVYQVEHPYVNWGRENPFAISVSFEI